METKTGLIKIQTKNYFNKKILGIRHWWKGWGYPADINDDGTVNRKDLLAVIGGWGRCPQ